MSGSGNVDSPSLSDLKDIKVIADNELTNVFMKCITFIYNYGLDDIEKSLLGRQVDVLDNLRKRLYTEMESVLPEFANRTLKRRIKDTTLCQDIVQLGYSLINKNPAKDLDKVFVQSQSSGEGGGDDDADEEAGDDADKLVGLITLVRKLEREVKDLKKQLANLTKAENPPNSTNTDPAQPQGTANPGGSSDSAQNNEQPAAEGNNNAAEGSNNSTAPTVDNVIIVSDTTNPSHSSSSSSDIDSESEMIVVQTKKKMRKKRRKEALQQANTIKAATTKPSKDSSRKDVYVGGVHPDNNASDICAHLNKSGIKLGNGDVRPLNQGKVQHSFCVSVPSSLSNKVLAQGEKSIWPDGVKVRAFTPHQNQKSRNQGSSSLGSGSRMRPAGNKKVQPANSVREQHRHPHRRERHYNRGVNTRYGSHSDESSRAPPPLNQDPIRYHDSMGRYEYDYGYESWPRLPQSDYEWCGWPRYRDY